MLKAHNAILLVCALAAIASLVAAIRSGSRYEGILFWHGGGEFCQVFAWQSSQFVHHSIHLSYGSGLPGGPPKFDFFSRPIGTGGWPPYDPNGDAPCYGIAFGAAATGAAVYVINKI